MEHPNPERAEMLRDSRRTAALNAAHAGYPMAAQLMDALADATQQVIDVTIPSDAYIEYDTDDDGPHIAVYAAISDTTPIIRIRVGDGELSEQAMTGAGLSGASSRLHMTLSNAAIRGGAL